MKPTLTALLTFALLMSVACHYNDSGTFISVTNHSGEPLTDIEVSFPRGTFGHPRLQNGEVFRHWGPANKHCNVTIKFADDAGRDYPGKDFDFGEHCPPEIQLDIDAQKNVSFRLVQKK
jgi:hypothetical protein